MLFEVIAVEAADSAIDHILCEFVDWMYKWSPEYMNKYKPYIRLLIRGPVELYMLYCYSTTYIYKLTNI